MNVFLVMCDHNAPFGWSQWVVAVYTTQEQAQAHIDRIQKLRHDLKIARTKKGPYDADKRELVKQLRQMDDDACGLNRKQLKYYVEPMRLNRHLDEYLENVENEW